MKVWFVVLLLGIAIPTKAQALDYAYPQWWGATGDNVHDDTAAIQAALDFCRGTLSGGNYLASCSVVLPNGSYRTTAQLNMYATDGSYSGMWLRGNSKYTTIINYYGPATSSVIRMIGYNQKISDLQFINRTGWLDAITYDGDPAIGISTSGMFDNIRIDCNFLAGNGVSLGRNHFQADQLELNHPYIIDCLSGYGIAVMDANSVSTTVIAGSIAHNWIGIGATTTGSTMSVYGGEFDNNDVNFLPGLGMNLNVTGIRSEGSKHTVHTVNGGAAGTLTFTSYTLGTTYWSENAGQPRPLTNGTTSGTTGLTLSVANSVTFGDWITIAGAGPTGGLLSGCRIANMASPTTATLDNCNISTQVTNAVVTFDTSREQWNFSILSGGPHLFQSCNFNVTTAETAFPAGGLGTGLVAVWSGNNWAENIANPYAINTSMNNTLPAIGSWFGNRYNSTTQMIDHYSGDWRPVGQ